MYRNSANDSDLGSVPEEIQKILFDIESIKKLASEVEHLRDSISRKVDNALETGYPPEVRGI